MRLRSGLLVCALALSGCSSDGRSSESAPVATPAPTPASAPLPSPSPTPTPTPTPTPPAAASYTVFDQLIGIRSFQSACAGIILPGQPPAVVPATAFGRGLVFATIPTPQLRTVIGDGLTLTFGPQDVDAAAPAGVIGYVRTLGEETQRFSISRPGPGGVPLDYARFALVSLLRSGSTRLYQCVIGVPTLPSDLPTGAVAYPRFALGATAYVRDTPTVRPYSTGRSTITFAADFANGRVTVTATLIGTPMGALGPDIPLGTISGSGTIDPATGGFAADLTSSDRTLSGNITGRFFGPQASEVGFAMSAAGPETAQQFAFSVSGSAYVAR